MQKEKIVPAIRFKGFSEEWSKEKIKELTTFRRGSFPQPYGEEKWYSGPGAMPFVQVADVGNALSLNSMTNQLISKIAMPFSVFVPKDSVIVTLQGTIGRVALTNYDCFIDRTILYFNSYRKLLDKTLFAILIKNKFEQEALLAPGAVIKTITKQELNNFELTMPNFNEQQKIGQFFSNLDSLIHSQELKLEKLQTIKQSLLNKMFASYDQKTPEIRFKGFDEPWKLNKFSELFEEKRVKTTEENEDTLLSCTIDDIYLNSELFSHFRGSSTLGYIKVMKYDLILSAQNLHLGNANVNLKYESGIISPAYKTYKITHSDPHFIQTWVKKENTKKFFLDATTEGASGCRKNVEWNYLYEQFISVPILIHEQQKIGQFFSSLDSLIHSQEQKLEKLNNIKQALLEKMFC
ncbi:restriction endonuclease subunit S [Mycoplasma sp. SK341A]|uniref:restriction endonuclease subunit S n=1 Tax=Mycoplasma sp. SK341A TaxID=3401679 RepID=UPI003AAE38BC